MDKKKLYWGLSVTVGGLVIFYFLIQGIDIEKDLNKIFELSPSLIVVVFILYFITLILRGTRYRFLGNKVSGKNLSLVNSSSIVGLQVFFNTVVVLRSGEFLYLYLMKREKINYQDGISYLIITRVLDFFCVSLLFVMSYVVLSLTLEDMISEVFILGLIVSSGLLVGWGIFYYLLGRDIEKFLSRFNLKKSFLIKLRDYLNDIIKNVKSVKGSVLLISVLFSLGIWLCEFMIAYLIFQELVGLGVLTKSFTIFEVIMGQFLLTVISVLPIHSVGGIGTVELINTISYSLLGLVPKKATVMTIYLHAVFLILYIFYGTISFVVLLSRNFFKKEMNEIRNEISGGKNDEN